MTKAELNEFYWIKRNIGQLEIKLLELETEATKITTRLTHEPKGSRKIEDPLAEIVSSIVTTQEEINHKLKKLYDLMRDIETALEVLTPREAYLIRSRYLELKSWENICVEMSYSWKHVHRIHSTALKKLAK